MTDHDTVKLRRSVIAALAMRRKELGRTAVMKLVYFLQAVRDVPLGYNFRIYTYGPYDGQVLDDLQATESAGAVRSESYEYDFGTGYSISATTAAHELARTADERFNQDLDWAVAEFGEQSAVELELASTIIFVDKRNASAGIQQSAEDLAEAVREMKPHITLDRISREVRHLYSRSFIRSVA